MPIILFSAALSVWAVALILGLALPDDDVLLGLLLSAALILNLAGWAATILG